MGGKGRRGANAATALAGISAVAARSEYEYCPSQGGHTTTTVSDVAAARLGLGRVLIQPILTGSRACRHDAIHVRQ